MKKNICFLFILFAGVLPQSVCSRAGNVHAFDDDRAVSIVKQADSLRMDYNFQKALQFYKKASDLILQSGDGNMRAADAEALSPEDSLRMESIAAGRTMAENGLAMTQYVSEPVVVARHVFSKEDFYLFYPMQDRSWRSVPNPLDSIPGHRFVNATYVPEGSDDIYFSAEDENGARNLYHTHFNDTLWTLPALLDESLTSAGDEIFPVLSSDGKTLYFASSGLYGVGGYDLYKTEWNESAGSWGVPENLGFPYSSPYDDLLYYNTPDGKYTLFASNRDCSADSVTVYVLEYDSMPVRRAVDDPEKIREIASLVPVNDPSRMDPGSTVRGDIKENMDISRYMTKMDEVRSLRDSVAYYNRNLEEKRGLLAESLDAGEKARITSEILEREARMPALQDSLERAVRSLQQIEMEFLYSGVVINPDEVVAQADREVVGVATNYAFSKLSEGDSLVMEIAEPEVRFDYSFMILPEGRFAEDNTVPDGIVYQIQIFLLSKPATVSQLKGLSPVFTEKTATGKYIYRVGLFRTYNDVLSNLNKVKNLGFKTAFIVAFKDGETCAVQKARSLESQVKKEQAVYQLKMVPGGESLPDLTIKAIRQVTDRDIVKTVENGRSVFTVGPIAAKGEAEKLEALIKISGVSDVSVVKLENNQ